MSIAEYHYGEINISFFLVVFDFFLVSGSKPARQCWAWATSYGMGLKLEHSHKFCATIA